MNSLFSICLPIIIIFQQSLSSRDGDRHTCDRECSEYEKPKVCYYKFNVESYQTFSKACYNCPIVEEDCYRPGCIHAVGAIRPVTVVNKIIPGPKIQVCENDSIVVDVVNKMSNHESVSLHWHGQHMKVEPFMDGVPMITQCPIPMHTTFRYRFQASNAGTHFWHSHTGQQRGDGLAGMLIVRSQPSKEPYGHLYDYDLPDHQIMLQDWLLEATNDRYLRHHFSDGNNKPRTITINGFGAFKSWKSESTGAEFYTPLEKFTVSKDKRYRFRMVSNAILNVPMVFSIDDHEMLIIASDGSYVKPVIVESLVIYGGERFDFVLNTTSEVDNYWIRVHGLLDGKVFNSSQLAVLHYDGASNDRPNASSDYDSMDRPGMQLNPLNSVSKKNKLALVDLESEMKEELWLTSSPDRRFYLAFDFYAKNGNNFHDMNNYRIEDVSLPNRLFQPLINNISNNLPSSPILSQPYDVDLSSICHDTDPTRACSSKDYYCSCVHILQVPLNSIVEIILIDEGFKFDANHPFHLHGHSFYLTGMGKLGPSVTRDEVIRLDKAGKIPRNYTRSILKDTITVPDGGYTIIKFKASNPGFWFFHCHLLFHGEIGMSVIIQVGDVKEHPKPPEGFPTCGNYKPPILGERKISKRQNNSAIEISYSLFSILLISFILSVTS